MLIPTMNRNKLILQVLIVCTVCFLKFSLEAQNPLVCDFRPSALQANSITTSSAMLSWNDPNNASSWEIEVRPKNVAFTAPNYTANSNPFQVTGLASGVEYKFRVRSVCAAGVLSNWSINPYLFITVFTNPSPCQMKLDIPDNNCATGYKIFDIDVQGVAGNQLGTDVVLKDVKLVIAHSWVRDVEVNLVSPNNKSILLTKENGGSNDNYGNPFDNTCTQATVFTELACNAKSIKDGIAPFLDNYFPEQSFSGLYDGSDPNGQWHLKVCDGAGGDIGTLDFAALSFLPVNCSAPFDSKIFGISYNAAYMNWKSNGPCDKSFIEIGPKGFTPGIDENPGINGKIFTADCPDTGPLKMDGLDELTDYDVYVRKDCGGGMFSANSCPETFQTYCNNHGAVTIVEDFDNKNVCSGCNCGEGGSVFGVFENSKAGDFDWLVRQGPTPSASQLTGPDGDIYGSGKYVYLETSGVSCQNGKKAILQSGCIKVVANSQDTCHFSFFYHMRGGSINKLIVSISDNGGATWNQLWAAVGAKGKNWKRAYLDLNAYNNKMVEIRFEGYTGNGGTGDIALDQIEFYGSTFEGPASYIFYADKDGDGYGDPNTTIKSCSPFAAPGFTLDNTDCNDGNNLIKPGGTEISCNGIDENCNGNADDKIITNPIVSGQNTCEGTSDTLTVISPIKGQAYWYTSANSSQAVFVGNPFITPTINANTIYYVMDSATTFGCYSQKVPVIIQVFKVPILATNDMPEICKGLNFNLLSININDLKNAGGVLSFHSDIPAQESNKISNTIVSPANTTQYYIKSLTSNGCSNVLPIILAVNPLPTVLIQNTKPLLVCPTSQAELVASVTGGTFPYNYLWSTGAPLSTTTIFGTLNPSSFNYFVTIIDDKQCVSKDSITVNTIQGISNVTAQVNDVTTCLGNNGSITLSPNGVGPYNYFWSGPIAGSFNNIPGQVSIMNLKKGSYSVTVTQVGNSCSYVIPVVIVNGPGVQLLSKIITDVSCASKSDGVIDLTVSGNNLSYKWSSGDTLEDLTNKPAGLYNVSITDGICDLVISNLEIKTPASLSLAGVPTSPNCFGNNTGGVSLFVSGGTAPYTFNWNNGSMSKDLSGVNAGNYQCSVTDLNGCQVVSSLFQLGNPPALQVYTIKANVSCYFGDDGVISISVLGGVPPYSFKWSDGPTVKDRNYLSAGNYKLSITDKNGCAITTSTIVISQPDPLQITLASIASSSCKNLANGAIDINVFGGTPPYNYLWSNNVQQEDLIGAFNGNYGVTVTDAHNCHTGANDFLINANDSILITQSILANTVCNTLSNGSIMIQTSGGNGNYSYKWSNNTTTKDLINIPGGSYQVTVSDNTGCAVVSKPFSIAEISPVKINVENLDIADCSTNQIGNIDISVTGKAPFNFLWSNGATTEDLFSVINGTYSISVTDSYGCKAEKQAIQLTGTGDPFYVYLDVLSPVKCSGEKNGKVIVQIDGGTPPFQYNWSIGKEYDLEAQIDSLSGLGSGNYAVTITDNKGCVVSDTVKLNAVAPLTINVASVKSPTCKGASTGLIALSITGGTKPYTYYWKTPDSLKVVLSQLFTGLKTGYYDVTVVDANGCSSILPQPIFLNEPPVGFSFENVFIVQPGCAGANSGSISVITSGGIGLTNYMWNPPSITGSFGSGLAGGLYGITVTDQNNCAIDTSVQLIPYLPMKIGNSVVDDPACSSSNNLIYLAVSQGLPPYQYLWSTGATSSFIDSLYAGTYYVSIKDAKGCVVKDTFTVGLLGMKLDSVTSTPNFSSQANGTAKVFISGGTPPYKYLWNAAAGGAKTSFVNNLNEGYYCVLVEDANGCKLTVCVEIENKVATNEIKPVSNHLSVFPNPSSQLIQVKDYNNASGKAKLDIFDIYGRMILSRNIMFQEGRSESIDIKELASGVYMLSIDFKNEISKMPFLKIE